MATGTFIIDFGATPTDEASVAVAEASITANSHVEAFIQSDDTTVGLGGIENTPNSHDAISFLGKPTTTERSAGVGFTAVLRLWAGRATGKFKLHYGTVG
jgi:hypothetical protein